MREQVLREKRAQEAARQELQQQQQKLAAEQEARKRQEQLQAQADSAAAREKVEALSKQAENLLAQQRGLSQEGQARGGDSGNNKAGGNNGALVLPRSMLSSDFGARALEQSSGGWSDFKRSAASTMHLKRR